MGGGRGCLLLQPGQYGAAAERWGSRGRALLLLLWDLMPAGRHVWYFPAASRIDELDHKSIASAAGPDRPIRHVEPQSLPDHPNHQAAC